MRKYKVWDELNSDEEEAKTVVYENYEPWEDGPKQAAIDYAGKDVDGLHDGCYTENGRELSHLGAGHPISVRDLSNGLLYRYTVGIVEFIPRYAAQLVLVKGEGES